jgi:sulfatase modifying factor 1
LSVNGYYKEMVLVPAGEFLMGAQKSHADNYEKAPHEEKPQHNVELESFYIDIHLVSVERYHQFILETQYCPRIWEDEWLTRPLQPIRHIGWCDIQNYCDWARKRLPTEAEWEKAARGGLKDKLYPWGDDEFNGTQACLRKKEDGPPDIGQFQPNGYGLYDMVGSLWQWCVDDRRLYTGDKRYGPVGPLGGETRSVRGGDWYSSPHHKRCSRRGGAFLEGSCGNLGFRCVRDVKM